jgi:hypothetical protein
MILVCDNNAMVLFMTLITTILLSFIVVLAAIGAMAIGALVGHSQIRGSCGGIGGGSCEICENDRVPPATPVQAEQEKL